MKATYPPSLHGGYSLIELMITVAIIAVIATIAIPAYRNYVNESVFAAARTNADSLRIPLEDYRLDNGSYVVGGDTTYNEAELLTNFGWSPDGDRTMPTPYSVTATTVSWDITVQHNTGIWIRCENRMRTCCDSQTRHGPDSGRLPYRRLPLKAHPAACGPTTDDSPRLLS